MRVFDIQSDGNFSEYVRTPFQVDHEEAVLEGWLESNPDGIVEDGRILIIGRQVSTNLGGYIDLLGVDREGDIVVVELKRDRTPRDTIAQSLEYASFAERLDTDQLEEILRSYLNDESGRDLKCNVTRKLTDTEVDSLVSWCESVAKAIREYGLKE